MGPTFRRSIVAAAALAVALGAFPAASARAGARDERATVREATNLRSYPSTDASVIAKLAAGSTVEVLCWTSGEPVGGSGPYAAMWLYTSLGGYLHSFQVSPVDVRACGY
ncbi:SH3 domain-containing protein [Catellatospora sp. KI3]|uniref:SH3 domain-containing protein n=1 Tax=Catellatospora sp. KI3 TaxID=3041620 RepID=UPI002482EC79|nr:SH3 domain-containing protein [Catellatospora sp. KI3]MDI1462087.1 SH3 domain-containing protein [Catellatospora sp. KI3]